MKLSSFYITLVCCLLAACQKDYKDSFPPVAVKPQQPPATAKGRLVRMQQGSQAGADTVYLITYDSLNRIASVTDSAHHETLTASYNTAGLISNIVMNDPPDPTQATFAYNAAGQLTQVDYTIAGSRQQLRFEYVNNVVSRKNYYTQTRTAGTFELFDYFLYEVSGGNITSIRQYNAVNQFVNERKLVFSQDAYPFRQLSLFNFANILGAEDIMNTETYFCANMLMGYSSMSQMQTVNSTYSQQKLIRVNAAYKDPFTNYQFIWVFGYD